MTVDVCCMCCMTVNVNDCEYVVRVVCVVRVV